jgi:NADPH-dependent curcumin reductase CurA
MAINNRQWILARRPVGEIRDGDLLLKTTSLPVVGPGELLVRTHYLSLDPTNRIWMSDIDQYMEPVMVGAPMRGIVSGEVVGSGVPTFKLGDSVMGLGSWSDYCHGPAGNFSQMPAYPGLSPKDVFGQLCVVAPTAYFGLVDIGAPKVGETLVVSCAAGAVGSIVGQLGKALGCRVIGIAGGREKCQWIVDELGFDIGLDYKAGDLEGALRQACPQGVDIYFDNVGGETLNTVMGLTNLNGRIIECGLISTYNADCKVAGPSNYARIVMKRLKVQGFIVLDHAARYPEAYRAIAQLHAQGRMKWRCHELAGLEAAAEAVRLLYRGQNNGKLLIKVV